MISVAESAESGFGLYSFPEVARYLHVHPRTLHSWFTDRGKRGPLLCGQIAKTDEDGAWLTFHDFLQAVAVNELKKGGVKPAHVREAIAEAKVKYRLPYPMSMREFELFADKNGKVHIILPGEMNPTELTGREKGQRSLRPIIDKYLNKVEFDSNGMAEKFIVFERDFENSGLKRVVMMPGINFGEPTVEGTFYRATTLRDAVEAEGSTEEVVRLYGVTESDVLVAIEACRTASDLKAAA